MFFWGRPTGQGFPSLREIPESGKEVLPGAARVARRQGLAALPWLGQDLGEAWGAPGGAARAALNEGTGYAKKWING